jgi:hypothetical protein
MPESMPKIENEERTVNFRELAPEDFWSGSVSIKGISQERLTEEIKEAAKETGATYSGYISEGRYHFSRYPRRAFGPVPSINKHREMLDVLANKLDETKEEESTTEEPKFRVLLGLGEGYSDHKKKIIVEKINKSELKDAKTAKAEIEKTIGQAIIQNGLQEKINNAGSLEEIKNILNENNLVKMHTIEEVKSELGEDFDLKDIDIYAAGAGWEYTEPAVLIEGDPTNLSKVYALAEKFKQNRIAVENLKEGKSHMVETKYCEDPDKE